MDGAASVAAAVVVGDRACGFVFAASWYLSKRAWMAKALSLGAWFLLGAFLIQSRSQPLDQPPGIPSILTLADGRALTLTAHVCARAMPRGGAEIGS